MKIDLDMVRASIPLLAVVGADIKLIRAGNEWKACCPFHPDRSPSFTIFASGERFHCFGCNVGGDVLDYLQLAHGVSFREALVMLQGGSLPTAHQVSYNSNLVPPKPRKDTTAQAASIWQAAVPISATPAEAYLRGRGLDLQMPDVLRFAQLPYGHGGKPLPCLVALVTDGDDNFVGIQRTFVREDGSGKADVPTAKLSLGHISGGAIRLAPVAAKIFITGGLEDGLTLQQGWGQAVWAATGEGNMANMVLPDCVRAVTIGADNDESGERHARRAAETFSEQGREARILRPFPEYKDHNAELQGVAA
ncbi:MAG: toprim domain-containing protein [Sphingomonas sp.]|nr:toprim domain-containing protein [Sphingomonas sp.]